MARESFPKRFWLAFTFIFKYFYIVLFKDLPRVILGRQKKIENQVIVITGGAMGMGKMVARSLSVQHKAKVCILDVNEKAGLETIEEIRKDGGHAYFYRCDVSDPQSLQEVANQIYAEPKLGFVDILVVNAAVLRFGEILNLTYDDYRLNNNVNILGHIFTVKIFLPKMVEAKRGHIVSMGSICSHYGEHYGTAYCAAKFACRGFMEALQMELYQKGLKDIALTSIYPYFVRTNFIDHLEEPFSTFFDVIPLEKASSEIVTAILKEKASHFIPGMVGILCNYLKCFATKYSLPEGRKVFNFTYEPKKAPSRCPA